MLKIGLTGGIASGKSAVSHWLAGRGYPVIDADRIARAVCERGEPVLDRIAEQFGADMILPDGHLDRRRLGTVIFADENKRAQLNALLHPLIRSRILDQLRDLEAAGAHVVFLDIPLLYETGWDAWVDRVLVVSVAPDIQLYRLMDRNRLDKKQAWARIASQMPLAEKARRADAVIDNSGTWAQTEVRLRQLLDQWSPDF